MKAKEKGSVVVPYKGGYLFVITGAAKKLDLPGGGMKSTDSNFEACALREGRQETGASSLTIDSKLGELFYISVTRGRLCRAHLFLARELTEEPRIIAPEEIFGFEVLNLAEVRRAADDERLRYPSILRAIEFAEEKPSKRLFHICPNVPRNIREKIDYDYR